MFAIGARWREDTEPVAAGPALPAAGLARPVSPWPTVALLAVVAAAWPAIEWAITRADAAPVELAAAVAVPGWTAVEAPQQWVPPVRNASATRTLAFRRGDDVVGVHVALYQDQSSGHKLVSADNALVRTDDSRSLRLRAAARTVPFDGTPATVREEHLRVPGEREIVALQWYVVDGHVTASDLRARLYTLLAQLRGHGDRAASIVVHTDARSAAALDDFVRAAGPALSALVAGPGAVR
jgi:EpsI family protein